MHGSTIVKLWFKLYILLVFFSHQETLLIYILSLIERIWLDDLTSFYLVYSTWVILCRGYLFNNLTAWYQIRFCRHLGIFLELSIPVKIIFNVLRLYLMLLQNVKWANSLVR